MDPTRRRFLRLGSVAAVGAAAGCSAPSDSETTVTEPTTGTEGDGGATSTDTATASAGPAEFDFGGWLSETSNYDGTTVGRRGEGSITVEVGVSANGGAFGFGPPAVWIDLGTEVVWEWTGNGGSHNVVAESGAEFSSGAPTDEAGTTYARTFDDAGIVTYFCEPHTSLGMCGALVVGDPDGGATTGQQE